jgi:hypothetical protein
MTILLASLAFGAILADVALLVTDVALLGPGLGSNTCAFDLLTSGIVVVLPWLVAMDASLDGLAVPRDMATLLASRTVQFATFVGQMSDHATTFALALRASTLGMRGVVARFVIFAHGFRRDRFANLIVKLVAIRLVNRATDNSQSGFGSNLGVHAVKHVGIRASLACVPCVKHPAVQDDNLADDASSEGN